MEKSRTYLCDWCRTPTQVFHELYRSGGRERLDRPFETQRGAVIPSYVICPECAKSWCEFNGIDYGDDKSFAIAGRFTQRGRR